MIDTLSAWVAAAWTALTLFIVANVEPLPGVWVAAISGSLLSAFPGPDRPLMRLFAHFALGVLLGVFGSQLIAEMVVLKGPLARGSIAFFGALFAEKIVAGIHNGSIVKAIMSWRRGK